MTSRPFFIVLSRPRCGSTALCQALNAHRDVTCLFEPSFQMTGGRLPAVRDRVRELRDEASGIKHVWEHAGPPFWPALSFVSALDENAGAVFAANQAIVQTPGARLVVLHRRDQWARAVSHLLGQQTDIWGLSYRSGQWELDDPSVYRSALKAAPIAPLDVDVLDWHINRGTDEERRLRDAAGVNPCLDVAYEDLLGANRSLAQRLQTYLAVLEFLGLPTDRSAWDEDAVRTVFSPDRKLNDRETFALIPNVAEVYARQEIPC